MDQTLSDYVEEILKDIGLPGSEVATAMVLLYQRTTNTESPVITMALWGTTLDKFPHWFPRVFLKSAIFPVIQDLFSYGHIKTNTISKVSAMKKHPTWESITVKGADDWILSLSRQTAILLYDTLSGYHVFMNNRIYMISANSLFLPHKLEPGTLVSGYNDYVSTFRIMDVPYELKSSAWYNPSLLTVNRIEFKEIDGINIILENHGDGETALKIEKDSHNIMYKDSGFVLTESDLLGFLTHVGVSDTTIRKVYVHCQYHIDCHGSIEDWYKTAAIQTLLV